MKQFYVYLHCKPDGTPFYVGKGSGRRAYVLNFSSRRNRGHHNIIIKHGKENILIYTRDCVSEAQAHEHEIWMIAWCRAQGYRLVNATNGGEGVSGYKWTDDAKYLAHLNHLGKTSPMKGKKHTEETKIKISKAGKGRFRKPCSDNTKLKISVANKGKNKRRGWKHTERAKVLMKVNSARRGKEATVGFSGRRHTQESKLLAGRNASLKRNGFWIVHS